MKYLLHYCTIGGKGQLSFKKKLHYRTKDEHSEKKSIYIDKSKWYLKWINLVAHPIAIRRDAASARLLRGKRVQFYSLDKWTNTVLYRLATT